MRPAPKPAPDATDEPSMESPAPCSRFVLRSFGLVSQTPTRAAGGPRHHLADGDRDYGGENWTDGGDERDHRVRRCLGPFDAGLGVDVAENADDEGEDHRGARHDDLADH